jgi:2'-5' RNA ligase
MPRLFVAIDLPDTIKDQLGTLCGGLPGTKWVKRDQLHLTLRFIGEMSDEKFRVIKDRLNSIKAAPFSMAMQGVGQFPPRRAARVLWVGVDAPPTLSELQQQVETTLTKLGCPPDERPFSAHITLARLKTPPPPSAVEDYLARYGAFQSEPFPISHFVLYSSVLAPEGPTYCPEAVYRLGD